MATVTSKGQVTLPKPVRDALGLRAGSQVEFEVQHGVAILRKRLAPETLPRWRGYLRQRGARGSVDELVAALRDP